MWAYQPAGIKREYVAGSAGTVQLMDKWERFKRVIVTLMAVDLPGGGRSA
jgi:hypothetical protein